MFTKKCIVCGKEFVKSVNCSLSEWFGGKNSRRPLGRRFCSKSCSAKHSYRLEEYKFGNKEYTPWLKGTKGVMKPNSGSFKKGNKLSKKTIEKLKGRIPWNKGRRWLEISGSKHHNWKGGSTEVKTAIRLTFEYKQWRKSVFERDNYICTKCGYSGPRLQAHHLKEFYLILEENKINSVKDSLKCKELFEIDNGKTLCIPCHKQTDSYLVNRKKINK